MEKENIAAKIIEMEKIALEKWNHGNPSGYLDIYSEHITYFDPFQEKRLDGLETMKKFYESLRGEITVDKYEMINPTVEVSYQSAVLSYNLISYSGITTYKWNCTEVYQMENNSKWKIVHNHWSLTNPMNDKF